MNFQQKMKVPAFFTFMLGSGFGLILIICLRIYLKDNNTPAESTPQPSLIANNSLDTEYLYDDTESQKLFNEIKILCMVMTHTANHMTKAKTVKDTWGRKCNKLIFLSEKSEDFIDIVVMNVTESRDFLWHKIKIGLKHLYDNYLNEYDWFFRADDDSYVIMENLRYMLAHYNSKTALYFGDRFAVKQVAEGYMAGGGYVLSRKALQKFQEFLVNNATRCRQENESAADDWDLGQCLQHHAIFVDTRDALQQKRFFPIGMDSHLHDQDPHFWYSDYLYYNVTNGDLDCCSEVPIQFHYINPREMYFYEYVIYQNHPFGWDRKEVDPPRKVPLQEIIDASDAKSFAPNAIEHVDYHILEDSEKY